MSKFAMSADEFALAGLGGMGDLVAQKINPAVLEFQRRMLANDGADKWRKQFIQQMHNLPEETVQGLMNGSLQIVDKVYYSRVDISSGTAVSLVPSESKSSGTRNIKDRKVDNPCVLHAISLGYSASAPAAFAHAAIAAEISRGELTLRYNKRELSSFPVNGTFVSLANYNTNKPYGMFELRNAKVLDKEKEMDADLEIPTAFAAGTHAVEIKFHVTEVVDR